MWPTFLCTCSTGVDVGGSSCLLSDVGLDVDGIGWSGTWLICLVSSVLLFDDWVKHSEDSYKKNVNLL